MGRTLKRNVLSEAEAARYKAISEEVAAKKKSADPKAALARIEKALADVAKGAVEEVKEEQIAATEGVILVGDILSVGDLEVKTDDVVTEEPRVVAEDEEDDDAEERSLWGDGEKVPGEEE